MTDDNTPKMESYHIEISPELNDLRLDVALMRAVPDMTRTRSQEIIRGGFLKLNGSPCDVNRTKVALGDVIDVEAPVKEIVTDAQPEDIPLDVMYEDDYLLVVNKPVGMVVHPAAGNWSGTLVNALLGREPELMDEDDFDPLRPGIVHRLDKDTSGALVIAKTPKALTKLSRLFAEREVEKTYLAIVHGWPVPTASVIKTMYGRHPRDRKKMAVLRMGEGREAITAYSTIKNGYLNGKKVSLMRVRLHTGRTHQIRVHFAYKGFPLLGETLYSKGHPASIVPRQMLHAYRLAFTHPFTAEQMEFEAPIPQDFQTIASAITKDKA